MTTAPQPKGPFSDWLVDRLLRGLIGTAMQMPYERRVPFMGAALRRGIGPIAGYRRRAEAHLAMIYPDMPQPVRRQVAQDVCDNFGRTLIENYSWQEFGERLSETVPTGAGLSALAAAKSTAQPVIFVTGHFGNHEAPRHVLTRLGYDIGGLYRPMSNVYFDAHYAPTMTDWGGPVFAQGRRGTMGFARHLKSGGMGTLLFDVASSTGIPLNFLGKPAKTATSAADIARKLDAVIIPYFATRQPDGLSFEIDVQAPIQTAEPAQMMQDMTDRLADKVTDHPEQWFWVHRRWK